jgi:hypothetical protein
LQQAADAAQDGDTIEVRSDGPVPGCMLGYPAAARRALTLRAAPGYRPVINSGIFVESGILMTVEGLDFRSAGCNLDINRSATPNCGIVRLANCSFSGFDGNCAVSAVFQSAAKDGCPEVCNCFIPRALSVTGTTSKLAIDSSIVGYVCCCYGGSGDKRIDIRQSILGIPGIVGERDPWPLFAGQTAITAQGTLFDAVAGPWNWNTKNGPSWQGAGNVYAMAGIWPSLEELRSKWKSAEEGSRQADPVFFDPQTWRLMPESAGYHAGPEGKDLGADVDRVGGAPPAANNHKP